MLEQRQDQQLAAPFLQFAIELVSHIFHKHILC
jgi:hypothetical protein